MSKLLKPNLVNLQFVEFVLVNFALLSMYLVAGHGTRNMTYLIHIWLPSFLLLPPCLVSPLPLERTRMTGKQCERLTASPSLPAISRARPNDDRTGDNSEPTLTNLIIKCRIECHGLECENREKKRDEVWCVRQGNQCTTSGEIRNLKRK